MNFIIITKTCLTTQMEYFLRHPGGVNPVLLNDVVFSVNAAFAQGLLILQCFLLKVVNFVYHSMLYAQVCPFVCLNSLY